MQYNLRHQGNISDFFCVQLRLLIFVNTYLLTIMSTCYSILQAKLAAEFKEKTGPDMLKVLQKNVKNGHIIGSEVCIIQYIW